MQPASGSPFDCRGRRPHLYTERKGRPASRRNGLAQGVIAEGCATLNLTEALDANILASHPCRKVRDKNGPPSNVAYPEIVRIESSPRVPLVGAS